MFWLGSGGPAVSKLHPICEKKRAVSVWGECTPTGSPFIPTGSLGSSPLLRPKTEREIKRIEKSVVRFGASGWETTIYLPSRWEGSSLIEQKCSDLIGSLSMRGPSKWFKSTVRIRSSSFITALQEPLMLTHELMDSAVRSKCAAGGITKSYECMRHGANRSAEIKAGWWVARESCQLLCVFGRCAGPWPTRPTQVPANLISALD